MVLGPSCQKRPPEDREGHHSAAVRSVTSAGAWAAERDPLPTWPPAQASAVGQPRDCPGVPGCMTAPLLPAPAPGSPFLGPRHPLPPPCVTSPAWCSQLCPYSAGIGPGGFSCPGTGAGALLSAACARPGFLLPASCSSPPVPLDLAPASLWSRIPFPESRTLNLDPDLTLSASLNLRCLLPGSQTPVLKGGCCRVGLTKRHRPGLEKPPTL